MAEVAKFIAQKTSNDNMLKVAKFKALKRSNMHNHCLLKISEITLYSKTVNGVEKTSVSVFLTVTVKVTDLLQTSRKC